MSTFDTISIAQTWVAMALNQWNLDVTVWYPMFMRMSSLFNRFFAHIQVFIFIMFFWFLMWFLTWKYSLWNTKIVLPDEVQQAKQENDMKLKLKNWFWLKTKHKEASDSKDKT